MYYGLQLSTSGVLTAMYRTDALANNLANVNTTGFKPVSVFTRQRLTAQQEDGLTDLPSNQLLESLGGGAHLAPNVVEFTQGSLSATGNPLDLAITGDGFFVLRDSQTGAGDGLRLTRDGRLGIGPGNLLVNVTTGLPVLDAGRNTIRLRDDGAVTVSSRGVVRQDGELLAQILVADVPDRSRLRRTGENMYRPTADAAEQLRAAPGVVVQGSLEASAVDPFSTMMQVTDAAGAVSTNIRIARYQDQMMDRAINTFARLS